jgi:hypothetical protein
MAGSYTTGTRLWKPEVLEGGWADLVNANFDRLSEPVINVKSYPNVFGDGTNPDTGVQAVIDAAPAGATIYFPGAGPYLLSQLTIDARLHLRGDGKNLTTLKAVSGATGPLINWNNSTLRPGCTLRGLTVDMTDATGIAAVYMHNVRNGIVDDLYISPGGTVALQLDLAQGMNILNVDVFNASTAAFKGTHASSSGNNFINCFSDNTTTTGVYGFFFDGGLDWWCIACRAFRAPGIAQTLRYGFVWDYTSSNYNATGRLLGCAADAISDLTSSSANVAGAYFRNVGNCSIDSSFLSCASVADGTSNACVEIAGSKSIKVDGSYLSGQGVRFSGSVSDAITVTSTNRFSSPDASGSMFTMTTTPTLLDAGPCNLISGSANIPITDNPAAFFGALTRNAQVRWGLNLNRASGALFETFEIDKATTNTGALTSGTEYLFGIWLPKGLKVTSITFASGATALVNSGSPHFWVELKDSSKNLLRQSTDQTSATIGANALKTVTLSSTFTTTYEGFHYLGIMVNSGGGTQPTYSYMATLSAITNAGSFVRCATGDTSLVGTAPNPSGATSNIGQRLYAYVS